MDTYNILIYTLRKPPLTDSSFKRTLCFFWAELFLGFSIILQRFGKCPAKRVFLLYKVINYPLQLTQLPKNNEGMVLMKHTYIILMATQRDSPKLSRSGGRVYQWGLQGALTTMFKNLLGACLRRLFLLCSAYLLCVCVCVAVAVVAVADIEVCSQILNMAFAIYTYLLRKCCYCN